MQSLCSNEDDYVSPTFIKMIFRYANFQIRYDSISLSRYFIPTTCAIFWIADSFEIHGRSSLRPRSHCSLLPIDGDSEVGTASPDLPDEPGSFIFLNFPQFFLNIHAFLQCQKNSHFLAK